MDLTLLISLLAFFGLIASWITLPTGKVAEKTPVSASVRSTSKA